MRVWDAVTGATLCIIEGHTAGVYSGVYSVSFSLDGKQIVSGSWDKTVRVWDVVTGATLCIMEGHTSGVSSV